VGYHRTPADDPTNEVQTPTMDSLCKEGIELNQSYAFWYCSPSRSAIQTGRNPIHVNVNNDGLMIHNPADPVSGFAGIPRNMTTIAWKMRDAGYATHFYGKWREWRSGGSGGGGGRPCAKRRDGARRAGRARGEQSARSAGGAGGARETSSGTPREPEGCR